ncbi:MAG: 16S rRNA (uracil(1498)-N(3))-methyltransferase [Spirochaetaceae bacterium]|jgi:16S rRNA (uracil1498-N3)-methyltransferase|nr:16S rRNA (uracil(1498)-N(3))-methyltransferase [Spirochaetaceae bacterium]
MKQFIISSPPDADGFVRLRGADYRYLARVRRVTVGDGFPAVLPDGSRAHVEVRAVDARCVVVQCLPHVCEEPHNRAASPPLYLFQAVPRAPKLELIVRQAAELGVAGVVPFYAERCAVHGTDGTAREERLRAIIRQARQQCGSPVETTLDAPLPFAAMLERWHGLQSAVADARAVFLHEIPLRPAALHRVLSPPPDLVAVAVGPEGGFSAREAGLFIEAGFSPIIVGNTILRTETAALYALAAVRTVLLEKETWTALKE